MVKFDIRPGTTWARSDVVDCTTTATDGLKSSSLREVYCEATASLEV